MTPSDIIAFTNLEGCVLDEPNYDRSAPELHHVYSRDMKTVFVLSKKVYQEIVNLDAQAGQNGRERIPEQGLIFGTFISFDFDPDNQITSFKILDKQLKTEKIDGRNFFNSLCVFNRELNKVYTEDFDEFDINRDKITALNDIPTSNISIICFIVWKPEGRSLVPSIFKLEGLAADHQAFVAQAKWNASNDLGERTNEFVDNSIDVKSENVKVMIGKRGLITGLTSVFVPDLFSYPVLLPTHDRKSHSIGRIAQCDLVYNDVLKSYVVRNLELKHGEFFTILSRKSDTVEGIFYVDLRMDEVSHGLYRHSFFNLIADPFGFLDLARYSNDCEDTKGKQKVFNVPIKDRLAKTNEHQAIQDLDLITRFEVANAGDDASQIGLIESLRNKEARLDGGGIVINKETGLVCGHQFSGIIFQLSCPHEYENGDPIVFKATRILEMDVTRPMFLITSHKRKNFPGAEPLCTFADGKFTLKAKFNEKLNCYEALKMFGYIPCKSPPPDQSPCYAKSGEQIDRIYEITAEENTHLPAQTVLFHGEFIREV